MKAIIHKLNSYHILNATLHDGGVLCLDIIEQLNNALEQAEDLPAPVVLLLSVLGQSAGAPALFWAGRIHVSQINKWERILHRIERTDVFTVVSAEGICSWLALELLLVGDRRLGKSDMILCSSQTQQEIWPSMTLYRLSRQIGEAAARVLLLREEDVDLATAVKFNLLDDQLPEGISDIDHLKEYLETAPIKDFAVRRRLIQDSLSSSYEEALGAHLAACDRTLRSRIKDHFDEQTTAPREPGRMIGEP